MKITKKVQYFIGDTQVVRVDRNLAKELGVSETTLRYWLITSPNFPEAVHSENTHAGKEVKYYPYLSAMRIIEQKLKDYEINRAKGIGRPRKE